MTGLPEPPFVLVATDQTDLLRRSRAELRFAGAQVAGCRTARVALEALAFHVPTVVVIDLGLEDGKGWDVLRAARTQGELPAIALERDGDGAARRAAFAAGADDVLPLTTDPRELAARVMALAGRVRRAVNTGPVYRHRGLVLDVAAHTARLHGRPIALTAQQFAVLRALLEANGAALDRARLLGRIEALDDEVPSERAIDLHVTRLRRRLGDDPRRPHFIESVYGVGYRLATGDPGVNDLEGDALDVLASLPDPLLVIDRQLRIRFANDSATRFLGLTRAQLVGRRCGEVLECRDCLGSGPGGARCFALATHSGTPALRDVPENVLVSAEREDVSFTIARVQGDGLLTIEIRPRASEGLFAAH